MKLWHLLGALAVALVLGLIASCGDSTDSDEFASNIPFTPIPTSTPVPKLCGNGVVDSDVGEECDVPDTGACGASESCICCVCLPDGEGLGERAITLARPASQFLSSALAGADISRDPWSVGPVRITAGRPDPQQPPEPDLPAEATCSAPLTLTEDVIFGFTDPLQATLCNKFFAEGSSGYLDCDGGTAHDVDVTIDSNGDGEEGPLMITEGLGDPALAGPGAATFRIARVVSIRVMVPPGTTARNPDEFCPMLNYDEPLDPDQLERFNINPADVLDAPVTFTTRRTRGEVLNARFDQMVVLPNTMGENFFCSTFNQTDARGGIVGNLAGLDNPLAPPGGADTMNAMVLFDHD